MFHLVYHLFRFCFPRVRSAHRGTPSARVLVLLLSREPTDSEIVVRTLVH